MGALQAPRGEARRRKDHIAESDDGVRRVSLPSRLGVCGASWALQPGSGRSPVRKHISGIFYGLTLLVKKMW